MAAVIRYRIDNGHSFVFVFDVCVCTIVSFVKFIEDVTFDTEFCIGKMQKITSSDDDDGQVDRCRRHNKYIQSARLVCARII